MSDFDSTIHRAIAEAIRSHSAPIPANAREGASHPIYDRFGNGVVRASERPSGEADLRRRGLYCTYAVRTTVIPLEGGYPATPTFWSPGVFFVPKDEAMRPETAYDGNPIERRVWLVPVDNRMSARAMRRKVFGHVTEPHRRLVAFYQQTGQRWEVLFERERVRCAEAGEPFGMPEFPAERETLS